jgi:putative oxidoreductase
LLSFLKKNRATMKNEQSPSTEEQKNLNKEIVPPFGGADKAALFLRIFIGTLLFTQAITKSQDYLWLEQQYPSIWGIPPSTILSMVGVIEAIAGVMLTIGLLTRYCASVMAALMFAAAFIFFPHQDFAEGELKFVYTGIYITLAISGGGRYSLDTIIFSLRDKD